MKKKVVFFGQEFDNIYHGLEDLEFSGPVRSEADLETSQEPSIHPNRPAGYQEKGDQHND